MTRWIIDNGQDIYRDYYTKSKQVEQLQYENKELQDYKKAYKTITKHYTELQRKHYKLENQHRKAAKIISKLIKQNQTIHKDKIKVQQDYKNKGETYQETYEKLINTLMKKQRRNIK